MPGCKQDQFLRSMDQLCRFRRSIAALPGVLILYKTKILVLLHRKEFLFCQFKSGRESAGDRGPHFKEALHNFMILISPALL
jgi:hypothetical protein